MTPMVVQSQLVSFNTIACLNLDKGINFLPSKLKSNWTWVTVGLAIRILVCFSIIILSGSFLTLLGLLRLTSEPWMAFQPSLAAGFDAKDEEAVDDDTLDILLISLPNELYFSAVGS